MSAHYSYTRLYRALRYGNAKDVKEAVFFLGEEADLQLSLCSNFGACGTAAYHGQKEALDALIELGYSDEEARRKRAIQQYWRVIMYTGDYDMARHLVDKYRITVESVERIFPKSTDPWDGQEYDQYMYADFACRGHFKALALACETGILEKPIPSTVQVVLGEALKNGHHQIRELGDLFLHSSGYRSWIRGLEPLQKAVFLKTSIPKEVKQLASNPVEASKVVGDACKLAGKMNEAAAVEKVLDLAQKLGLDKTQMADLCCDAACARGSVKVLKFLVDIGLCPYSEKWSKRFQRKKKGRLYDDNATKAKALVFIVDNFRHELVENGRRSWGFVVTALAEDGDDGNLKSVLAWAKEMKENIDLVSEDVRLNWLTPEVIELVFDANPFILDHEKLNEIPFMRIATNEKWLELLREHRPEKFNNVGLSNACYVRATCLHLLGFSDNFRQRVQEIRGLSCSKFLDYFPNDCKLDESLDFLKVGEDDDFRPEFRLTDLDAMNKVFRHAAGLRLQWPELVSKFQNLPKATKLYMIDTLYLHGIEIVTYSSSENSARVAENWAKKWSSTARFRWKFRPVVPLKALARRAVRIYVRASRLDVPMCCEDKVLSLHTKLARPLVDYLMFRKPNSNFDNKHRSN